MEMHVLRQHQHPSREDLSRFERGVKILRRFGKLRGIGIIWCSSAIYAVDARHTQHTTTTNSRNPKSGLNRRVPWVKSRR